MVTGQSFVLWFAVTRRPSLSFLYLNVIHCRGSFREARFSGCVAEPASVFSFCVPLFTKRSLYCLFILCMNKRQLALFTLLSLFGFMLLPLPLDSYWVVTRCKVKTLIDIVIFKIRFYFEISPGTSVSLLPSKHTSFLNFQTVLAT